MIYGPTGAHARQVTMPFLGRHVKWLINGTDLLVHLKDLETIRIEARCNSCGGHCSATPATESGRVSVRCNCRAGRVVVERPLVVEALLLSLGWGLVCTHCGERVTGHNDQRASTWRVTCPCTSREYTAAVA